MNRLSLINSILNGTNFKTYLEIGCYKGRTFFKANAKFRIAVDPSFHWSFYKQVIVNLFKNNTHKTRFFKTTSDDFFIKNKFFLERHSPLDIVLIDGLHTFKASLTDVFNTLKYLQTRGIIILHDCNPPNAGAAMATVNFPSKLEQLGCSDWTGAWCGDVWKTIVYLREHHADSLDVNVVDTDSGLGIITLISGSTLNDYAIDNTKFGKIDSMSFKNLVDNKKLLLGLENVDSFRVKIDHWILKTKG